MKSLSSHFLNKPVHIVLTNNCDVACGGCSQYCPNFPKHKIFFLSIEELHRDIQLLAPHRSKISIFGGEPVTHPQWNKIIELLHSYPKIHFQVFTKYKKYKPHKNVSYRIDFKWPSSSPREYYPSLVAPIDIIKNEDANYYWKQAQKGCRGWTTCPCPVYQGKLYFCERAGAMDLLFGGDNGWEITKDINPFIRTNEEINKQASNFCHQCGSYFSCMKEGQIYSEYRDISLYPRQYISEPAIASPTNWNALEEHKNMKHMIKLL